MTIRDPLFVVVLFLFCISSAKDMSRSLICYQCMYFVAHSVQMVEVLSVKLHCTVASRFAHTVMTSTALNKANSSQEIFFEVDLPKTAFITNFSM